MGNVILSPNMKKTRVQMDANGNLYDPKTKELIRANKDEPIGPPPDYIPHSKAERPVDAPPEIKAKDNPIADMIKKQVQQAVLESIKEIDLKSIINQAIKDALK